jgi:uncharacterized membrane protein (DUF106 family)
MKKIKKIIKALCNNRIIRIIFGILKMIFGIFSLFLLWKFCLLYPNLAIFVLALLVYLINEITNTRIILMNERINNIRESVNVILKYYYNIEKEKCDENTKHEDDIEINA